jgi:hypothetical protein
MLWGVYPILYFPVRARKSTRWNRIKRRVRVALHPGRAPVGKVKRGDLPSDKIDAKVEKIHAERNKTEKMRCGNLVRSDKSQARRFARSFYTIRANFRGPNGCFKLAAIDAFETEEHVIQWTIVMILAERSCHACATGDTGARAMRSLFGQTPVNDQPVQFFL